MKSVIYVVEDEEPIRELYGYILDSAGFEPHCFSDAEELYSALESACPDLFILDVMLSGDDGFTILTKLKNDRRYRDIPTIMVSAKGEEISKVKGLNLGADDYVSKPFGVLELVARVKANLRKNHKDDTGIVTWRDIVVSDQVHNVTINGITVATTVKEYNLLKLLCENAGTVMTRENIFAKIWDSDFIGETRTLDVHIKDLRKKLSETGSICEIVTVRGVGYLLK